MYIRGKHTYIAFALVNREQLKKLADLNAEREDGFKKYLLDNLCDYYPLDKKSDLFEQVNSCCFASDYGSIIISYELPDGDGMDDEGVSDDFVENHKIRVGKELFDDLNFDDGKYIVGVYIDDLDDSYEFYEPDDYFDTSCIEFFEPFIDNSLVNRDGIFVDARRVKYNGEELDGGDSTYYGDLGENVLFFGFKTNKDGVIIPDEKLEKAKADGLEGKMLENNMFPIEELLNNENIKLGTLSSELVIPDGTLEIEDGKYKDLTHIVSVVIPDSVTKIGGSAFRGCTSLTTITIPNSVTEIGSDAFSGCTSLTTITIPDSVTEIGSGAFEGCSSLASSLLIYGNGKTCYGWVGLKDCTTIAIPDSVTEIGESAFEDCTSLTTITIPDSVTEIGYNAFTDCTSLTTITIPNSVTEIDSAAFRGCTCLTTITIPDSVTEIGSGAFSGCTSLTTITIPDSVTEIGESAFSECTSLTTITIPDSVTEIGESAFSDCTSLTTITIPDSVTEIGDDVFEYCENLKTIYLPTRFKKDLSFLRDTKAEVVFYKPGECPVVNTEKEIKKTAESEVANTSTPNGALLEKVVDKKDAAGRDHSKWSVNGEGEYNKQEIVQHTVLYVFGNLLKSMPLDKAVEHFNTTAKCTKAPLVVIDNAKYPKYKETVVSDGNSNYTVYAKDWLEPDEAPVFVEKVNANFK